MGCSYLKSSRLSVRSEGEGGREGEGESQRIIRERNGVEREGKLERERERERERDSLVS